MKVRSGKGVFAGVFELLARVVLRRPWAVIGAWLLLGVALSVAVPPLMKLASDRNQELLPSNSAVMAATRDMTAAFHEPGIQNIALVVLTDENVLTKADEDVYRTLVDSLHRDTADVVMVRFHLGTTDARGVGQQGQQGLVHPGRDPR